MKPYMRLVLLLSVVVMVAAASHGVCHRLGCGKAPCATAQCFNSQDSAWLAGELNLAPEQKAKFDALEEKYRIALADIRVRHQKLKTKLDCVLFDAGTTQEVLDGLVVEMSQVHLQADSETVRHFRDIDGLLTPEQRQIFRTLVSSCVCGKCPAKQQAD